MGFFRRGQYEFASFNSSRWFAARVSWFAFVAIQYTRQRSRMRAIASELHMENRDVHVIAEPLAPPTAVDGEERLLVVGVSSENFVLCSIVRNLSYNDWRGQWKSMNASDPDISLSIPDSRYGRT